MDQTPLQFAITTFVTLLVVVDPFGIAPIFLGLTRGESAERRREILERAIRIALVVGFVFLVGGRVVLEYLGVTVHAFSIAGGVLLFANAVPMLFGDRAGLQGAGEAQQLRSAREDIAVFPLAIPLLSGPGLLTTVLVLTSEAGGRGLRFVIVGVALVLVFALTWIVLRSAGALLSRVGESGIHVATRVMGIVLAAIATQFVLNGFRDYWSSVGG